MCFIMLLYILQKMNSIKCCYETFATVVKLLQQLQKGNRILISLQTYARTGFRTLQTKTEYEFIKKIKKINIF